jgi:hypothetical protein
MDPDGEFVSLWFGLPQERRRVELVVSTGEAEWFNSDRMTR